MGVAALRETNIGYLALGLMLFQLLALGPAIICCIRWRKTRKRPGHQNNASDMCGVSSMGSLPGSVKPFNAERRGSSSSQRRLVGHSQDDLADTNLGAGASHITLSALGSVVATMPPLYEVLHETLESGESESLSAEDIKKATDSAASELESLKASKAKRHHARACLKRTAQPIYLRRSSITGRNDPALAYHDSSLKLPKVAVGGIRRKSIARVSPTGSGNALLPGGAFTGIMMGPMQNISAKPANKCSKPTQHLRVRANGGQKSSCQRKTRNGRPSYPYGTPVQSVMMYL